MKAKDDNRFAELQRIAMHIVLIIYCIAAVTP
jgi:hypothetical protein